jgi:uncharacterized protein (UPF0254 family)
MKAGLASIMAIRHAEPVTHPHYMKPFVLLAMMEMAAKVAAMMAAKTIRLKTGRDIPPSF